MRSCLFCRKRVKNLKLCSFISFSVEQLGHGNWQPSDQVLGFSLLDLQESLLFCFGKLMLSDPVSHGEAFYRQHDDLQKELKCGEHAIFKLSVDSAVASVRGKMATRQPNHTQMQ